MTYADHLYELRIACTRSAEGVPHRNFVRIIVALDDFVVMRSTIAQSIVDTLVGERRYADSGRYLDGISFGGFQVREVTLES